MSDKKIDVICIGAALVDMVARVERHPEEDDEVFVSQLDLLSGGAAANTAAACAKLGIKAAFLGKLGKDDEFGNKIIKDFKEVGVETELIKFSVDHGTGSAYVALNEEGDRRIYAHSGAANILSSDDIIEREIQLSKIVFLSSLKNLEPFKQASIIAKENKIPIILNPGMLIIDQGFRVIKPLLENITILILSKREIMTLLCLEKIDTEESKLRNELSKLTELGIKLVIITLGERGALLWNGDSLELIPSIKVEQIIDTTGAGDAFSAGFIYGFLRHLDLEMDALIEDVGIGNHVAGHCIQELGARKGIPTAESLRNILE